MGIIYRAKNLTNGKSYVGQTTRSLEARRRDHEYWARSSTSENGVSAFHQALRKYEVDSFEWVVIFDNVRDEDLDMLEIDAILVYRTLTPNGYNLREGGSNGKLAAETKIKISNALTGRKLPPKSEAHRIKLSISNKGKPHGPVSEATRKKISEANKGMKCPKSDEWRLQHSLTMKGKKKPPRSDAHRKAISEAHRGKKMPPVSDATRQKLREASRKSWEKRKLPSEQKSDT